MFVHMFGLGLAILNMYAVIIVDCLHNNEATTTHLMGSSLFNIPFR